MIKRTLKRKRKGFSLVELVVVMAIIGILLLVMAPSYKGFIDQAKTIAVKTDAKTLQSMISLVEVGTKIDSSQKVSALSALVGEGAELKELKAFIDGLQDTSIKLKEIKISEVPQVVSTGVIPAASP